MTISLQQASISNFRSINGSVTIPMDAPVILLHGPNGVGKTSILSALELALTGDIPAMRRADEDYQSHLIHHDAELSRIRLDYKSNGVMAKNPHTTIIRPNEIEGPTLLRGDDKRFYSERCYLAQATLGRLLEIYQNVSTKEQSPLTRFVNDLLGLDTLDALIDGLVPATDIRHLKRMSAEYTQTIKAQKEFEFQFIGGSLRMVELSKNVDQVQQYIISTLTELSLLTGAKKGASLPKNIKILIKTDDEEAQLVSLNKHQLDLASIRERGPQLTELSEAEDEAKAVKIERNARAAANAWRSKTGETLEALIEELRKFFPDLPSMASTDPITAYESALHRVEAEGRRCSRAVTADDTIKKQIEQSEKDIRLSRARVARIDERLESIAGETEGLSQALASMIPHIHGDDCPVCGRNYGELSGPPLMQRVSAQVARLAEQTAHVQDLSKNRARAAAEQAKEERSQDSATGQALSQAMRDDLKERASYFAEASGRLAELEKPVKKGGELLYRESDAQRRLAEIRNRNLLEVEIRHSINNLCRLLDEPAPDKYDPIMETVQLLTNHVSALEKAVRRRLENKQALSKHYEKFCVLELKIRELNKEIDSDEANCKRLEQALAAAHNVKDSAKEIRLAAIETRSTIVGRVFNKSLNKIWRDLFVRLAPFEPFVPAFKLPNVKEKIFMAHLETIHRSGKRGGAPGAMLSAGNLNTAALVIPPLFKGTRR